MKASAWSAADVLVRQGLVFLVSVILARLLTPEAFGTIALLTFFTSLSIVFVQGGLSVALIQQQQTSLDEESAIFWWNLAASLLLALSLVLAGPWIADFFSEPLLRSLVPVAAAQLIFSAAGAVHSALLTRELRFDLLTKVGIVSSLGSGVIAIVAAYSGAGAWALALQVAAMSLFNTAGLWLVANWRPAFHFRFETIRSLFGFGAWVSAGNLVDVLYTQSFALLVGKLHGVRDLGFFNQAAATQLLPSSTLATIVGRVSLPLLASTQHDQTASRANLRLALRCSMILNLPAMVGLALLSDLIVLVLFGPQWLPAAPILSILAISGILFPVHTINIQFGLASGRSAAFMKNEMLKKILGMFCVLGGSFFGIIGLAWSQVVYSGLGFVVNAGQTGRNLHYGTLRQLSDLTPIASMSVPMMASICLVRAWLETGPLVTLGACIFTGAVSYAAAGLICAPSTFRHPFSLVSSAFLSRRNKTPAMSNHEGLAPAGKQR